MKVNEQKGANSKSNNQKSYFFSQPSERKGEAAIYVAIKCQSAFLLFCPFFIEIAQTSVEVQERKKVCAQNLALKGESYKNKIILKIARLDAFAVSFALLLYFIRTAKLLSHFSEFSAQELRSDHILLLKKTATTMYRLTTYKYRYVALFHRFRINKI